MKARVLASLALLGASMTMAGCSMHGDTNPPQVVGEGIVSGHAALTGIRPFNGRVLDGSLLSDGIHGDVVSLDIWPIGGFGIGVVGARIKLLVVDVGLGAIFYHPKPAPWTLGGGKSAESGAATGVTEHAASRPAY